VDAYSEQTAAVAAFTSKRRQACWEKNLEQDAARMSQPTQGYEMAFQHLQGLIHMQTMQIHLLIKTNRECPCLCTHSTSPLCPKMPLAFLTSSSLMQLHLSHHIISGMKLTLHLLAAQDQN
jgi:hypothetical protein